MEFHIEILHHGIQLQATTKDPFLVIKELFVFDSHSLHRDLPNEVIERLIAFRSSYLGASSENNGLGCHHDQIGDLKCASIYPRILDP